MREAVRRKVVGKVIRSPQARKTKSNCGVSVRQCGNSHAMPDDSRGQARPKNGVRTQPVT